MWLKPVAIIIISIVIIIITIIIITIIIAVIIVVMLIILMIANPWPFWLKVHGFPFANSRILPCMQSGEVDRVVWAACALGRTWRRTRRFLPAEVSDKFAGLLLALQPYVAPRPGRPATDALWEARADVAELARLFASLSVRAEPGPTCRWLDPAAVASRSRRRPVVLCLNELLSQGVTAVPAVGVLRVESEAKEIDPGDVPPTVDVIGTQCEEEEPYRAPVFLDPTVSFSDAFWEETVREALAAVGLAVPPLLSAHGPPLQELFSCVARLVELRVGAGGCRAGARGDGAGARGHGPGVG